MTWLWALRASITMFSCKSKQVQRKSCSPWSQYSVQFLGVKYLTRISLKTCTNIKAARQQNIHLNLVLNQSQRCKPETLALQLGCVTHISGLSSIPVLLSAFAASGDLSLVGFTKLSKCTGQAPPSLPHITSSSTSEKSFPTRKVVFRKKAAIKTLTLFPKHSDSSFFPFKRHCLNLIWLVEGFLPWVVNAYFNPLQERVFVSSQSTTEERTERSCNV